MTDAFGTSPNLARRGSFARVFAATMKRTLLPAAALLLVLGIFSPALIPVLWHLRHGNVVAYKGKLVPVPRNWYPRVESQRLEICTASAYSVFFGRACPGLVLPGDHSWPKTRFCRRELSVIRDALSSVQGQLWQRRIGAVSNGPRRLRGELHETIADTR